MQTILLYVLKYSTFCFIKDYKAEVVYYMHIAKIGLFDTKYTIVLGKYKWKWFTMGSSPWNL